MAGPPPGDDPAEPTDSPGPRPAPGPGEHGPAPVPDAELLARHVAGDHDAFGELVSRHRDRLWAVALRTLGDREEAADALQDALVSAFRGAHTFQGRSAVTTWLHRIVVNACLDGVRRSAGHPTRSLDDRPTSEELLGHGEGADISAERGELRRELADALATLPPEQRAALVLVDVQGYPVAEAAAVLEVPVGTVKSRCARGRARLLPLIAHLRSDGADSGDVSRETVATGAGWSATDVSRETSPRPGSVDPPGGGNPNEGSSVPPLTDRSAATDRDRDQHAGPSEDTDTRSGGAQP